MFIKEAKIFLNPKVLSQIAIVISILTFLWTIYSQWDQNKKWDALNLCKIELVDVGFIMWREIDKEEAFSTTWGYKPIIFSHVENRLHTGKYRLPYELIFADPNTLKRVPNSNGFFTLSESQKEAQRIGLSDGAKAYTILKHFQVQFDFKNVGNTTAIDTKIEIVLKKTDTDSVKIFTNENCLVELVPSGSNNIVCDFPIPLDVPLPEVLNFEVKVTYKSPSGEPLPPRKIPVLYDSERNYWMIGK